MDGCGDCPEVSPGAGGGEVACQGLDLGGVEVEWVEAVGFSQVVGFHDVGVHEEEVADAVSREGGGEGGTKAATAHDAHTEGGEAAPGCFAQGSTGACPAGFGDSGGIGVRVLAQAEHAGAGQGDFGDRQCAVRDGPGESPPTPLCGTDAEDEVGSG